MIWGKRESAASVVINNGKTLWITGGFGTDWDVHMQTSEYVSLAPTTSTSPLVIEDGPPLIHGMSGHCLVQSRSGQSLFIGGEFNILIDPIYASSTFWYSNSSNDGVFPWSLGPQMHYERVNLCCGILYDKDRDFELVMVAGGIGLDHQGTKSVEFLYIDGDNDINEWLLEEEALCDAREGADGVVDADKTHLILVGGRLREFHDFYHKTLCSCQMVKIPEGEGEKPSCKLLDQELRIGRAFLTAMLIPDSFANCY